MGANIHYNSRPGSSGSFITYDPGDDAPLVKFDLSDNPYDGGTFYHQDGIGSVVAKTGTAIGTQRFDAWGVRPAIAPELFGYAGREAEPSGLYNMRARYYDPYMRRFIQRDPIGLAGGINQYAYAGNNPVNFKDTDGNTPMHAAAGLVGAAGGLLFQLGMDAYHGHISSFADYAGSVVGGAAGGVAAVSCGAVCAGAAAGAAANLTTQAIGGNGFSPSGLAVDTAVGAIGGKVAAVVVPAVMKPLSSSLKGDIGEGLSAIGLRMTGQEIVRRDVRNGFGMSNFDFELGNGKFVESKFGTSAPKGKQLEAVKAYGDDVDVQKWTYDRISGMTAAGPMAGLGLGQNLNTFTSPAIGAYSGGTFTDQIRRK